MASRLRDAAAPLYLFACLLAGGSAQGIWQNMVLQLLGIGILAGAAASEGEKPLARPARQLCEQLAREPSRRAVPHGGASLWQLLASPA